MSTQSGWSEFVQIVRAPVRAEAKQMLAENWASLAPSMRVPQQMFGRQGNGCGATIGAMPRCDFACRGCYLNAGANTIPAASLDEIKAQIRALRPVLGHAGNLQLTDGEVTLRPVDEIVELLRYAQSLGLIPMLMTHGDSFRRRPGLLEDLMVRGGLVEVSIHVDTTQRGRLGDQWRRATSEWQLNPLREEFADMIRAAQRTTGLPLRAATTMTVTRENLNGVGDVMRWLTKHSDAFRLISFQPIAQVGRTEDGFGGGVDAESVWAEVARGLQVDGGARRMSEMGVWFGHEACNRMVNGAVLHDPDGRHRFRSIRDASSDTDVSIVDGFLARFGGISFRLDEPKQAVPRALGLVRHAPGFMLHAVPRFAYRWLQHIGGGSALLGLLGVLTGRRKLTPLTIVSHHFMSREQIVTPEGQKRLAHCVFRVPVRGQMLSMCEVNALGYRESYYETLRAERAAEPVPASHREKMAIFHK